MLEWTASVMIAIEPVIAPATSFSRISAEFEAIESRAAPALRPSTAAGAIGGRATTSRRRGRRGPVLVLTPSPATRQLAGGAAAMADRVLLGRRQLGHRAPVARGVSSGTKIGS